MFSYSFKFQLNLTRVKWFTANKTYQFKWFKRKRREHLSIWTPSIEKTAAIYEIDKRAMIQKSESAICNRARSTIVHNIQHEFQNNDISTDACDSSTAFYPCTNRETQ